MQKERFNEHTRRQQRRIEAMKRGEYMLSDPRTTSVDEIAHVVWQQDPAFEESRGEESEGARKGGAEKNKAPD